MLVGDAYVERTLQVNGPFETLAQLVKEGNLSDVSCYISEGVREYSSRVDLQCRFNYLSENGSDNSLARRNLSRAESPICDHCQYKQSPPLSFSS